MRRRGRRARGEPWRSARWARSYRNAPPFPSTPTRRTAAQGRSTDELVGGGRRRSGPLLPFRGERCARTRRGSWPRRRWWPAPWRPPAERRGASPGAPCAAPQVDGQADEPAGDRALAITSSPARYWALLRSASTRARGRRSARPARRRRARRRCRRPPGHRRDATAWQSHDRRSTETGQPNDGAPADRRPLTPGAGCTSRPIPWNSSASWPGLPDGRDDQPVGHVHDGEWRRKVAVGEPHAVAHRRAAASGCRVGSVRGWTTAGVPS